MCGSRSCSVWITALCVLLPLANIKAGTVDVSCSNGVQDYDGSWLQGAALLGSGDLVQVIYAGANGLNDLPDVFGNPTNDDILIGTTFIGAGFPINPNEGKFAKQFTDDLLAHGNTLYVRAWNGETVAEASHFGDSPLATISLVGGFGAVDFPTWAAGEAWVAIELFSFTATAVTGGVRLAWSTESETENLGFHIYRSTEEDGIFLQINKELIRGAGNSQERKNYFYDDFEVSPDTTYYYKLADIDFAGHTRFHGVVSATVTQIPDEYNLEQNYPNPFNPTTAIIFDLKDDGLVSVRVFNLKGQLVRTLIDGEMGAGRHKVTWDATDDNGMRVPTGMYMYTFEAKGVRLTKSMLLLK